MPKANQKRNNDVTTEHPEYTRRLPRWTKVADCFEGEASVKEKTHTYLPRPSGFGNDPEGQAAWNAYLERAHFPSITSNAVSGLMGLAMSKPPKFNLPKEMEYLLSEATPSGVSLIRLFYDTVRAVLMHGRSLLLLDVDMVNDQVRFVPYSTFALINWKVEELSSAENITLAVLKEDGPDDGGVFGHDKKPLHRVLVPYPLPELVGEFPLLSTNEGPVDLPWNYTCFEFRDGKAYRVVQPSYRGKLLEFVPLVIIGSTDLNTTVDISPVEGIADCAIQAYRKDADLSSAEFFTCNPLLVITGVQSQGTQPIVVGPTVALKLSSNEAKAYYLTTDAAALVHMKARIESILDEAGQYGAALLQGEKSSAESGEALRIRSLVKTATLATVLKTVGEGFERALKWAARWQDIPYEDISVEVDVEFINEVLGSPEIAELIKMFTVGAISKSVLIEQLIKARVIKTDKTPEQIAASSEDTLDETDVGAE